MVHIDLIIQTIVATIVFLYVFAYFPGKVIGRYFYLPQWRDLEFGIGLVTLMLVLFFGRFLFPTQVLLLIYLFTAFVLFFVKRSIHLDKKDFPNFFVWISILLGTISMAWSYIVVALHGSDAIQYDVYRSHDQSWHVALIAELVQHFPPQVPGYSGEILKNYHYFMDLVIAANYQIFGGDIAHYIQLTYPIIFTILFGMSVYRMISIFTNITWVKVFTILLAYLGNNLSFLLLLSKPLEWRSDIFFVDQPVVYLGNHQTVLSLALFFYFIILITSTLKQPQKISIAIITTIILAALIKVKVYAFVVAGFLFALWSIWQVILYLQDKDRARIRSITINSILLTLITGLIYILSFKGGKAFIVWEPGWLLQVFYERAMYPLWPWFKNHFMVYKVAGNPKYYVLLITIILLFIILNLGVRIVGLAYIFVKKRNINAIFLLISSVLVFCILLLTRQAQGGYNIIQFGPYAICSMSVLTGAVLARLRMPTLIGILIATILLITSMPVTLKTIYTYKRPDLSNKNKNLIYILETLRKYPDGITAHFGIPTSVEDSQSMGIQNVIGAIGYHRAYLIDKVQIEVLEFDWKQKQENIDRIAQKWCNFDVEDINLIKEEKIKYFLIPSAKVCEGTNLKLLSQFGPYALIEID